MALRRSTNLTSDAACQGRCRLGLTVGLLLGLATACAAPGSGRAETPPVVQQAKNDMARRLGVPENSIELVGRVDEVTWPDTSLGCPEPGGMYAQVLTPGYRFKLRSGETVYQYHASQKAPKLCNR